MKKKIVCLLLGGLLLTGCGKVPKLENGQDAVVSFKNGEKISVDDLYNELKDNYALLTLINLIDRNILEDEFKDYVDTAKEYAESYIKALEENYESADDLLKDIQDNTGLASIDAYEDQMYYYYLQSHAIEAYAQSKLTDKEIEEYYEKEVVGDIEVSHILITPDVTDDMEDEEKTKAEEAAKKKAQEIINTLKDTKKEDLADTFSKLAKENSKDDSTKDTGGALGKINKTTLGTKYDELVKAAYNLKDNEYSTKVITTELGYHVILKTKSYEKASLKDSTESIKKTLGDKLISSDATISVNALQHYRKEHGMDIQDSELKKQYSNYIQNQLAYITSQSQSQNQD